MTTVIKTKNSTTTTTAPSSLAQGELAVNITDKKLWVGNAATTPVQIAGNGFSPSYGALTATSITDSGLTSGRVTYATTAGLLTDSANLTFNGTTLTANTLNLTTALGVAYGGTGLTSLTAGYIPFGAGTSAFGSSSSLFWDSVNGRLGVGTISPNSLLDIAGTISIGGKSTLNTTGANTVNLGGIANNGLQTLNFYTNTTGNIATLRATLDSSGNLGLGVTPSAWASGWSALQIKNSISIWGSSGTSAYYSNNTYYDGTSRKYVFTGAASEYETGAGAHIWKTAPSGTAGNAITFTQAMTLDASGNLLVGRTNQYNSEKFSVQQSANGQVAVFAQTYATSNVPNLQLLHSYATGANTATQVQFLNAAGSTVGSITSTTSATAYVTSSDYRLKEDIAPMTGALATVAQLKPVTYKWKIDGSDGQGFIAHELQAVVPDAVTGEKDAVDEEGNPKYQGIDTSFLVATLTAALQELKAEVDSLKAQLNK